MVALRLAERKGGRGDRQIRCDAPDAADPSRWAAPKAVRAVGAPAGREGVRGHPGDSLGVAESWRLAQGPLGLRCRSPYDRLTLPAARRKGPHPGHLAMKSVKASCAGRVVAVMLGWALEGCATSSTPHRGTQATSSSTTATAALSLPSTTSTTRVRIAHMLGPLGVVRLYWRDIATGKFRAAYGLLAVGSVPQDQTQFASDEQQAQIQSVTFTGSLALATGASATSSLFVDDDRRPVRIRTWSGEFQLDRAGHSWRITRAHISPAPCASRDTASGTALDHRHRDDSKLETVAAEGPGSHSHAGDARVLAPPAAMSASGLPQRERIRGATRRRRLEPLRRLVRSLL